MLPIFITWGFNGESINIGDLTITNIIQDNGGFTDFYGGTATITIQLP